ncbi:MAG: hypothetical protein R2911_20940 [Caldilineaceae bacterium]
MIALQNPYVGPRTFTQREASFFFGRERETRDLYASIVSSRLMLFYAQSGAGKSSLLNAGVIPQLRANGFEVLPVARVSGALPERAGQVDNVYVMNLLLSIEQGAISPAHLAQMTLTEYLGHLVERDGLFAYDADADIADDEFSDEVPPRLLIIDQFEELFTTHAARWTDREGFFHQLREAMADDPLLFVLISMRADYIALLDPYAGLVPGRFRNRFYMERMGLDAALTAIQEPAARAGRPFAPGVAETLVDNLRVIRVGLDETQLGQFIEPVQLQLVCYQIWDELASEAQSPRATSPNTITQADLERFGDVDNVLFSFYENTLLSVLGQSAVDISERRLRNWIESQLITEARTRSTVYRGAESTAGLPNTIIDALQASYLLRSELRAGGVWIELVNDRFIEPILQSNARWRAAHPNPFAGTLSQWEESGRSDMYALAGSKLAEAEDFARQNPDDLTSAEREFVSRSRELTDQSHEQALKDQYRSQVLAHSQEHRQRTRLRWTGGISLMLIIVLAGTMAFALGRANRQHDATISQLTAVLLDAARSLAQKGAAAEAITYLESAQALVPAAEIDPKREVFEALVADMRTQASAQNEDAVRDRITQALSMAEAGLTESPAIWNTLCRSGSLYGFAQQVVNGACEWAVAAATEEKAADCRDSRGLARALTGNVEGALADFKFYVAAQESSESRQAWIARLAASEAPESIFDAETLAELKKEW